jgi:hypothetical protein
LSGQLHALASLFLGKYLGTVRVRDLVGFRARLEASREKSFHLVDVRTAVPPARRLRYPGPIEVYSGSVIQYNPKLSCKTIFHIVLTIRMFCWYKPEFLYCLGLYICVRHMSYHALIFNYFSQALSSFQILGSKLYKHFLHTMHFIWPNREKTQIKAKHFMFTFYDSHPVMFYYIIIIHLFPSKTQHDV